MATNESIYSQDDVPDETVTKKILPSCRCRVICDSTSKQKSQWEDVMKEFSEKNKEKCRGEEPVLGPCSLTKKIFPTGSTYEGPYEDMNMRGYGTYTFPNGVIYRGEFESNMCHGDGELIYQDGDSEEYSVIRGKWVKGIMTKGHVFFSGILEHDKDDWKYCKMPDRRYVTEFNKELKPGGQSNITFEQPPREIPPGYRDTGYGFYKPETKVVYRYDNIENVKKAASKREQDWINDHCRMEPPGITGPRPDFYQPWLQPDVEPAPLPNLLVGFDPGLPEYDTCVEDELNKPLFYDARRSASQRPHRKFQRVKK